MAHDVFISYSTKDKVIANAVCAKLEQDRIRAWIAPRDVPGGANFAGSIIEAINDCKVFVLIWSANINASGHILNEINQAFDQGITIIPFRIQDVQPTNEMRYYFGRTHWLDAIDPPLEKHIATLRDAIRVILGPEPQPEAPPKMPEQAKEPSAEKAKPAKPPAVVAQAARSKDIKRYLPIAVGGLAVLTLVVLLGSGALKGLAPAVIPKSAITPTAAARTTATARPTATLTPIPAWMAEANALADPILAAVQGRPPDFADDFSQADASWTYQQYDPESDSWGCENTNTDDVRMEIRDGRMQIRGKRDCALTFVYQPKLEYASSLLQADVRFPDEGAQLSLNLELMKDGTEQQELIAEFQFGAGGNWSLATLKAPGSTWLAEDSGLISLDISEPVRLTHINRDNASIVLLNAVPVSLYRGEADAGALFRENFMVVIGGEGLSHVAVELDNIKVWDLDKIGELRAPVTNPENGHLYSYVEENSTWHQARQYCQSRGWYLAAIEDASENAFIYQLTGGVSWLGATDEAREAFWVWANAQPMEYSNFAEGQPSMHGSRGAGYLTFSGDVEAGDMLETWRDAPAEFELPFVCEWEADGQQ